jgi:putative methionine-R-sulfoxide reductase with GAF domain
MSAASWCWGRSRARPPASASRSARACAARPPPTREVQLVEDVHAFPGHIACDAASRSELVVPIVHDGALIGVLDLDSPSPARFDAQDAAGCAELIHRLAARLAEMASTAPAR